MTNRRRQVVLWTGIGTIFVVLACIGLGADYRPEVGQGHHVPTVTTLSAVTEPDTTTLDTVSKAIRTTKQPNQVAAADASVPLPAQLRKRALGGEGDTPCFRTPDFPLIPLEAEVKRLYEIALKVLADLNATAWPTDGTLLGLMRHGRIVTDRDVDMQIHSTYKGCAPLLQSMKAAFEKYASIKSFKVVYAKTKAHGKVGRYVMVRLFRKHGSFDTGVDFNCVYMDNPDQPMFHVHKGTLDPMPLAVYPLGLCWFYDRAVPCPRDGYAVLEALRPRYEGCMTFPHCFGDPSIFTKRCMSPHPLVPLQHFVDSTRRLRDCGFTSLADHHEREPKCRGLAERDAKTCESTPEGKLCFVQAFKG